MSSNFLTPTFTPFASGCGMCKPSTDYYSVVTGGGNYSNDGLIPKSNGENFYHVKDFSEKMNDNFIKNNYGIDYATSFGGKPKTSSKKTLSKKTSSKKTLSKKTLSKKTLSKKPASKKSIKGGSNNLDMISEETRNEVIHEIMNKIDSKSMQGGSNNLDMIFEETYNKIMNKNMKGGKKSKKGGSSLNYSEFLSEEDYAHSGGKRSMKGGMESSGATSLPQKFFNPNIPLDNYNELAGNGVMTAYGANQSANIGSGMLAPYHLSEQITGIKTGGKRSMKKSMKGGKSEYASITQEETQHNTYAPFSMKGGMESSGATPLPIQYFNPNVPMDNYNELAGKGVMTDYGANQSANIGSGMLAPYNLSEQITGIKTGGKRSLKKSMKGGDGPIPYISDSAVTSVNNSIDNAISGFSDFMVKLDEDYLKSVDYVKSIKIGNQLLIQGGDKKMKSKETKSKETKSKETKSKETKSVKKIKSKKGGSTGSDFALTLNSRGPSNAPDDYWGVPGEQWFRQFTKTGDYIPNSQLAYAATPLSAGIGNSPEVVGYDSLGTDYGSV